MPDASDHLRTLLELHFVDSRLCSVRTSDGLHVGNLKLIGGVWKFKALGYDAGGQVIPGGGPLTAYHNVVFSALDEALVNATLA